MQKIVTIGWDKDTNLAVDEVSKNQGFRSMAAFGLNEAKQAIARTWPDLIFLDISFGESAGLGFLKALRNGVLLVDIDPNDLSAGALAHYGSAIAYSNGIRKTPVVAIVDDVNASQIQEAQQLGVTKILRKPLNPSQISDQMNILVADQESKFTGVW